MRTAVMTVVAIGLLTMPAQAQADPFAECAPRGDRLPGPEKGTPGAEQHPTVEADKSMQIRTEQNQPKKSLQSLGRCSREDRSQIIRDNGEN